jgi:hypothetical protein
MRFWGYTAVFVFCLIVGFGTHGSFRAMTATGVVFACILSRIMYLGIRKIAAPSQQSRGNP